MKYIAEALIIIAWLSLIGFLAVKVSPLWALLVFTTNIDTRHWFKDTKRKDELTKLSGKEKEA